MERIKELEQIVTPLLAWYKENKRSLPWREDTSPYRVWVSEIMLQQTRVEAGRSYFQRFMEELPRVESLANVGDEALMKLWEGLGYYSRARNLKKAAGIVVEKYGGELPDSYEELLALPGIGPYTAGAVASIAFGLPVPAVDGNVLRVISRIGARREDVSQPAVKKAWEKEITEIIPQECPGDFNQALMELGAIVCLPNGAPKCGSCPVAELCQASRLGIQEELPVKKAKKGRKIEEKTVFILLNDRQEMALRKRPEKGLLSGMWELPWLEGRLSFSEAAERLREKGVEFDEMEELPEAKHIFSHIEWKMAGYRVQAKSLGGPGNGQAGPGNNSGQQEKELCGYKNGPADPEKSLADLAKSLGGPGNGLLKYEAKWFEERGDSLVAEEPRVYLKDVEDRKKRQNEKRQPLKKEAGRNEGTPPEKEAGRNEGTPPEKAVPLRAGEPVREEPGLVFAGKRELAEIYALPSAFKGFKDYFPQ